MTPPTIGNTWRKNFDGVTSELIADEALLRTGHPHFGHGVPGRWALLRLTEVTGDDEEKQMRMAERRRRSPDSE